MPRKSRLPSRKLSAYLEVAGATRPWSGANHRVQWWQMPPLRRKHGTVGTEMGKTAAYPVQTVKGYTNAAGPAAAVR